MSWRAWTVCIICIAGMLLILVGLSAKAAGDHTPLEYKLRAQLAKERHKANGWMRRATRHGMNAKRWRTAAKRDPEVNEALVLASRVYGVPLSQMRSVAFCESRFFPGARNGPYRGLFQEGPMFERGPFGDLSVWSPYANAFTAAYTVAREGWRQWECKP